MSQVAKRFRILGTDFWVWRYQSTGQIMAVRMGRFVIDLERPDWFPRNTKRVALFGVTLWWWPKRPKRRSTFIKP